MGSAEHGGWGGRVGVLRPRLQHHPSRPDPQQRLLRDRSRDHARNNSQHPAVLAARFRQQQSSTAGPFRVPPAPTPAEPRHSMPQRHMSTTTCSLCGLSRTCLVGGGIGPGPEVARGWQVEAFHPRASGAGGHHRVLVPRKHQGTQAFRGAWGWGAGGGSKESLGWAAQQCPLHPGLDKTTSVRPSISHRGLFAASNMHQAQTYTQSPPASTSLRCTGSMELASESYE